MERPVNNLNNNVLHTYKNLFCTLLFTLLAALTATAQQRELDANKKYTLNNIEVTGTQTFNKQTVIAFTGLRKGEELYIPGERLSAVTKKLWEQNLFSDIAFYVTNVNGNLVDLELYIVELPKMNEVKIEGMRKGKQKEFIKENNLTPGVKITKNLITTIRNNLRNTYREKGYYNARALIGSTPQLDSTGTEIAKNLNIMVSKGQRVKVATIKFIGNEKISGAKLRRAMKNTKQKNPLRIFKSSKYTDAAYEEDKTAIIDKYKENGYRDARITNDTLIVKDSKNLSLQLTVEEGKKYYFGDIKFVGNSVYSSNFLRQALGIKKGETYNGTLLEER
ncbi:MAG: POTRA domain-containing protein, partial [Marinirhabdus sp.]